MLAAVASGGAGLSIEELKADGSTGEPTAFPSMVFEVSAVLPPGPAIACASWTAWLESSMDAVDALGGSAAKPPPGNPGWTAGNCGSCQSSPSAPKLAEPVSELKAILYA